MPSLFSDKNALYLLTVLEAIEKIKLYAAPYNTAELLFDAEDQLQRRYFVPLIPEPWSNEGALEQLIERQPTCDCACRQPLRPG